MARVLLAREAERDLGRLLAVYRAPVDDVIGGLADEPLRGKPLKGELSHLRSLRVGVYRVIYRFDGRSKTVIVETIRHRSEAYR